MSTKLVEFGEFSFDFPSDRSCVANCLEATIGKTDVSVEFYAFRSRDDDCWYAGRSISDRFPMTVVQRSGDRAVQQRQLDKIATLLMGEIVKQTMSEEEVGIYEEERKTDDASTIARKATEKVGRAQVALGLALDDLQGLVG